jgi:hypothetical protein
LPRQILVRLSSDRLSRKVTEDAGKCQFPDSGDLMRYVSVCKIGIESREFIWMITKGGKRGVVVFEDVESGSASGSRRWKLQRIT